jgi:hypothetical protein
MGDRQADAARPADHDGIHALQDVTSHYVQPIAEKFTDSTILVSILQITCHPILPS